MREIYLSSGQAAQRLGLSRSALLRAVQRGELVPASYTPAGYTRFRLRDVDAYGARPAARRPEQVGDSRCRTAGPVAREGHADVFASGRAAGAGSRARRSELAAYERTVRSIYGAIASGVVMLNPAGEVVDANAAAQEMLGLRLSQLRGTPVTRTYGAVARPDGAELSMQEHPALVALRAKTPVRAETLCLTRRDGRQRWLQVDAVPILDHGGVVRYLVVSLIDLTERYRAEAALKHQALHDALTGLPNRTLFHDRLHHSLMAARRDEAPLSLLLVDLNRFKEVNDTLGHHFGDLLLQQVGLRIQGVLRAADTVARLGGDEFGVVLPATDAASAAQIVGRLHAVMNEPFMLDEHSLDCGGSIGIARYPDHGSEATSLLRCADVAMYTAKRSGGGYAIYNPAQDQHSFARLSMERDLRRALAQGDQFALSYQPLVDLTSGCLCRVEALMRWSHPQLGYVPPDQFIPLAEQTGLIGPLTHWVLDTALRQMQAWRRAGHTLGIAINVSMRTLSDGQIIDVLGTLLGRYDITPEQVTVEITESALMADPTGAASQLMGLRDLGVRIAIDDFGTGYSSLAYLRQLPIDEIKIDKSFVLDLHAEAKEAPLVCSMIAMAHMLGMSIVAEGVETKEAYQLLESLGGVIGQGYHISRPLAAVALERWLLAAGGILQEASA